MPEADGASEAADFDFGLGHGWVDDSGFAAHTIVLLIADHGDMLCERGL
jgi:hypothetical protein